MGEESRKRCKEQYGQESSSGAKTLRLNLDVGNSTPYSSPSTSLRSGSSNIEKFFDREPGWDEKLEVDLSITCVSNFLKCLNNFNKISVHNNK